MRALVIVDVQRDFLEGGALAVPDSADLPRLIARHVEGGGYDLVVATQDWHPRETSHFDHWPVHCVAGTPGAELDPLVDAVAATVFRKGTAPDAHGYSALDNPAFGPALAGYELDVCGLALDYCVRATAIAAARGREVRVLRSLTRAVQPRDARAVLDLLTRRGVGVS